MEGVYGKKQHMEKEERFRKCKRSIGRIQRKNEYRSKEAIKDRYGRRKRFQEGRATGEVHSKAVIWVE